MARPKGLPKTGGRKPGAANKRTKEIAERLMTDGITMAEIMVGAARAMWFSSLNERGDVFDLDKAREAGELAVKAAPYFHPKLAAIEHTGKDGAALNAPSFEVVFVDSIREADDASESLNSLQ